MKINQLQYFIKLAEEKSFSAAADKLFVVQSTISKAIVKLEEEFNITLFQRDAGGVELTEEGKKFFIYASNIVSKMEILEERFIRQGAKDCLDIKVGIDKLLLLGKPIARWCALNRATSYHLTTKETFKERMIEYVLRKEIECAIIIVESEEKEAWHKKLEQEGIQSQNLVVETYSQLTKQDQFAYEELKQLLSYCTDKYILNVLPREAVSSNVRDDALAYEVEVIYTEGIELSESMNIFIQLVKGYFQEK